MRDEEHDITKKLPKETLRVIDIAIIRERDDDAFLAVACRNIYFNPNKSSYSCRGCTFFYRRDIRSAPGCEINDYVNNKHFSLLTKSDSSPSQSSRKA